MAGSLVQVSSQTVTGTPTTVQLLGMNSTYDTYYIQFSNCVPTTDDKNFSMRMTESGVANSTASSYINTGRIVRTDTSFSNVNETTSNWRLMSGVGNATGEGVSGKLWIYNATRSGELTFYWCETLGYHATLGGALNYIQAGHQNTTNKVYDGVEFAWESASTFSSGKLVMYGFKTSA